MREIPYDLYAGHKHLYIRHEKQAGKGVGAVSEGIKRRDMYFVNHPGRAGVRHEAQLKPGKK